MSAPTVAFAPPRFATALAVEAYKLRRSLALLLAAVAPLLIAVFVFFNALRLEKPMPWQIAMGRHSRLGGWLIRRFNLFARGAAAFGTKRKLPADVKQAYSGVYDGWENAIATLRFMQDIPLDAQDRAWPLLTAAEGQLPGYADRPAFIGWGLRDFVFDQHFLAGFTRALPQAQVRAFDDAGHYVLEDKHEVLVPEIRAFLDAHPLD